MSFNVYTKDDDEDEEDDAYNSTAAATALYDIDASAAADDCYVHV